MRVAVFTVLIALLSACGTTPDRETPPPAVSNPSVLPPPSAIATESAPGKPESGVLPNVVGMNHQSAQDALQAAGFYYLTEEDATGQGRILVSDRNWVVVEQVPAAGATLAKTEKILLRSKKKGE